METRLLKEPSEKWWINSQGLKTSTASSRILEVDARRKPKDVECRQVRGLGYAFHKVGRGYKFENGKQVA